MNKVEKIIYDLVKGNPSLKFAIRNIYQLTFDLFPNKKNFFKNKPICKEGYFFGFHDISPFFHDDTKLLANKLTIPLRMPTEIDELIVGFFSDNKLNDYSELDRTLAWNYHKGCRLQWIGKTNQVIYNVLEDNQLKSKIRNLTKSKFKIIDWPIDTVSSNGKTATSFSYERLNHFMPGYGYIFKDESFLSENTSEKTGLFIIDLIGNKRELLLSLKQLSLFQKEKSMEDSKHYVTHTLFSPDNQYVSFLHRWIKNDIKKVWTRLLTIHLKSKSIYASPTNGMVSHYVWKKKSNEIIAYCRINGIDSHVLFTSPHLSEYRRIACSTINSDGHQSFIDDSSFITDTYPNRRRYAKLYSVNTDNNKTKMLAEVKSMRKFQSRNFYKHWACDLHPRMNNSGTIVSFDSVHSGKRAFCIMNIE